MSTIVEYAVEDQVAWIHLNRPHRLNATNRDLIQALGEALSRSIAEQVRAVVLAGRGRSFCAGHDFKQQAESIPPDERRLDLERMQDVTRLIRRSPAPIIAAVQGFALGGGCEFALCSDLIVASENAVFGFPEVSVGLAVTGGISHLLPMTVGLPVAKQMLFTGEHVDARRALELGLINKVVPDENLEAEAAELARRIVEQPATAVGMAKRALDRGSQSTLEIAFAFESENGLALYNSPEAKARAEAFRTGARGEAAV